MSAPRKITVQIPQIDATRYPMIRLIVEYPGGKLQKAEIATDSCREYEFTLPHYIRPKQCAVYVEMCLKNGVVDPETERIIIQEMPQRKPAPKFKR